VSLINILCTPLVIKKKKIAYNKGLKIPKNRIKSLSTPSCKGAFILVYGTANVSMSKTTMFLCVSLIFDIYRAAHSKTLTNKKLKTKKEPPETRPKSAAGIFFLGSKI